MWKGRVLLAVVVAVLVGAVSAVTAEECADRDRDGFSERPGCGEPADCDDLELRVFPGAIETCNGRDDDCDGELDEGCPRTCFDAEVWGGGHPLEGDDGLAQTIPALVKARDEYAVLWTRALSEGSERNGVRFARLDAQGKLVGQPVDLESVPADGSASPRSESLVWTGRSFFALWTVGPANLLRLDVLGEPVGKPAAIPCGGTIGGRSAVWTGRFLVATWVDPSGTRYIGRSRAEGNAAEVASELCASRQEILAEFNQGLDPSVWHLAWNGNLEQLGFAFENMSQGEPDSEDTLDIFLARYTEDLVPLGVNNLTDNQQSSGIPRLTAADEEWGVTFLASLSGNQDIAFLRVTGEGKVVDPPGLVRVSEDGPEDYPKRYPTIAWTGEEYGIFYGLSNGPFGIEGDILLARVTGEGEVLEPKYLLTPQAAHQPTRTAIVWNGADHTVIRQRARSPNLLVFERMGCRCSDADGDGVTTCRGDCDDTRDDIPGVELCGNGIDDDCDGLADCQQPFVCPPGEDPPGEATGVEVAADRQTVFWDPTPLADRYDATRGRLTDLWFHGGVREATCLAQDLAVPELVDPERPTVSEGFYYLVRAETGSPALCRQGTWGGGRDDEIDACP
jgi:hypothetical protein